MSPSKAPETVDNLDNAVKKKKKKKKKKKRKGKKKKKPYRFRYAMGVTEIFLEGSFRTGEGNPGSRKATKQPLLEVQQIS